jgi:hypothetical protein
MVAWPSSKMLLVFRAVVERCAASPQDPEGTSGLMPTSEWQHKLKMFRGGS